MTEFTNNKKINQLLKNISTAFKKNNKKELFVKYLAGSSKSFFVSSLYKNIYPYILLITNDNENADEYYQDLLQLIENENVSIIKEPKYTFKSKVDNLNNSLDWLVEGLTKYHDKESSIIILNVNLLNVKMPNPKSVISSKIRLKRNQNVNFDTFVKELMLNGFERKDYVSNQGEISIRGGIVDLFPIGWDNPLRLDFWGDTIESIRQFETLSQRSIKEYDNVEFISSLFSENDNCSVFEYLNNDFVIFQEFQTLPELDQDTALLYENFNKITLNSFDKSDINFQTKQQSSYSSSIKNAVYDLIKYYTEGYTIILTADTKIHLDRLKDIISKLLQESGLKDDLISDYKDSFFESVIWSERSYSNGFIWQDYKLILFTEHQLFDRSRARDTKKNKSSKALTLRELQDLKIGDYIVHEDKGIGLFDGFKTVEISNNKQDCVKLKFADGDFLYVNVNYINKISKYAAQEGSTPVLSKLGSTEWLRKKARTKNRLKDIARDLIKLYSIRKMAKGYAYPYDNLMQKEFEASFIYEDTPDQSRTTEEIKSDMESTAPMDRLVCGDVGFGKTEVAIRAAFKAVQSSKQVAVLVPTTILAQQHFMSFKDRFAKFPVNIEVISRFRNKMQQQTIVDNLSNGKLDILIGTHRLLSKDIKFKDLGLLVIDEEHRFGVSAKEKLRQIKENIDTLTLTATPIPRTLNFSLMGARDLSIMETPPRNRLPVTTEILEWNDESVIEIIELEINRGGQVFFVSDKVEDLDKIAKKLQDLVPQCKMTTAHGQMPPHELEKVMEGFIENKFQILLATKIIESGIDIPNANTIIINRAQNFGLAELYQLRGRVGRTNIQAYCYLIIPETYKLNGKALRRLQAIEEFTELGSGFQLSMRDLEIRGAGNLLGAEQSGFIIDIGFELFHKILDEAVYELKTDEFADIFSIPEKDKNESFRNDDVSIEIDKDALFPKDYIKNDTDRFTFYKRLYQLDNLNELKEIIRELEDRYGKLPSDAENLIFAVKLRIAALKTGFVRVAVNKNKLVCDFPPLDKKYYYDNAFPLIIDYISSLENVKFIQTKTKLTLEFALNAREDAIEFIWKINKTLELI